jgi:DNA-binding NarL/FixJ family response regulator
VAEAKNGQEAIQISNELKPDLVLLDISLPDRNGLLLIQDIKRSSPKTRIMIVSMYSKINYVVRAFQTGATGYITKDSAPEKLLQGLDCVFRDEYFMDSSISRKVVERLANLPQKAEKRSGDTSYDSLTTREQQIMHLLAEGLTPRQIADKLYVSIKTVENHRSNIMKKLDLHSSHELIRYAARLGLIDVDLWKD